MNGWVGSAIEACVRVRKGMGGILQEYIILTGVTMSDRSNVGAFSVSPAKEQSKFSQRPRISIRPGSMHAKVC